MGLPTSLWVNLQTEDEQVEAFLTDVAHPTRGTWGATKSLLALATALNRVVIVYTDDGAHRCLGPDTTTDDRTLRLLYTSGNHYDSATNITSIW